MLTANKWHSIPAKNDIFRLALTSEALTALVVEAKKRGVSYGQLIATTDQLEREQIVKDYYWLRRRKARRSGK